MKLTPQEILAHIEAQKALSEAAPTIKAVESNLLYAEKLSNKAEELKKSLSLCEGDLRIIQERLKSFGETGEISVNPVSEGDKYFSWEKPMVNFLRKCNHAGCGEEIIPKYDILGGIIIIVFIISIIFGIFAAIHENWSILAIATLFAAYCIRASVNTAELV